MITFITISESVVNISHEVVDIRNAERLPGRHQSPSSFQQSSSAPSHCYRNVISKWEPTRKNGKPKMVRRARKYEHLCWNAWSTT